jgi:endo-1,4-beta-xylanase
MTVVTPAAAGKYLGTIKSDNGVYSISQEMRYNQPSIDGARTYVRMWSVRTTKRIGGTITTKNHFDAWQSKGVVLGSYDYQAVTVQGSYSNGKANITFKEVLEE